MRIFVFLVAAVSVGMAMKAAADAGGVPALFFNKGGNADETALTLQRLPDRRIRVLDRQTAYRNDRKPCVRFTLPSELPLAGVPLRVDIEAYNDDPVYLRSLWFEVDGVGGYLAVQRVGRDQYRGIGTIGRGERKRWVLPLNRLALAIDGKAISTVNFDEVFRQPGPHTVCAWISTYAKYGPGSWVTLDLVGRPEVRGPDGLLVRGRAAWLRTL